MTEPRKKIGRPHADTQPVMIRMSTALIQTIDDRRRREPDLPSRPEMVRRLIEAALAAEKDR